METKEFDCCIVGGGVAGMSAAIYASRRGKKVAIVEKFSVGGQVNSLTKIENFPSQTQIDGLTLSEMFREQVKALGVEIFHDEILKTELEKEVKILYGKKATYSCKSVVIATGLSHKTLGIGEEKFLGRGVSFCATCDANFYKGKKVCVVGKGGSAYKSALELANVCKKVVMLDSEDVSILASANKNQKIEIVSNCTIVGLSGEQTLKEVSFVVHGQKNKNHKKMGENFEKNAIKPQKIEISALFVDLGRVADVQAFAKVEVDENGFVLTDENMKTNLKNVFAVGDVRAKGLKQIVTACSDGAIAGNNV